MEWNTEYLYHYTTFESAVKIIASRTLLFSDIKKLNDINESCGPTILYSGLSDQEVSENEKLLSKYIQISLTTDTPNRKGFDIPAMWGHYASRGYGVCLVFDKRKFIASIDEPTLYHHAVEYTPLADLNEILYDETKGSFEYFISVSKKELFFHKTLDWAYEQEYRVIAISDERRFLNIQESLVAVILHNRCHEAFLSSVEYAALSKVGADLEFYRYTTDFRDSPNLFNIENQSIKPPIVYDFSILKSINTEE